MASFNFVLTEFISVPLRSGEIQSLLGNQVRRVNSAKAANLARAAFHHANVE